MRFDARSELDAGPGFAAGRHGGRSEVRRGSTGTQPGDLAAYMGYASEDPKRPLFAVHGSSVDAIVDAIGDMVIEYVQVDAIPDSPDVAITSADAQAQATSFLSDRDRDTGILLATTTLQSGAASAYVVTWADKSGGAGQISVWVNPSTGTPYAFADQRFGVQFVPPSISAAEAGRLALATVSAPGEVVLSADLQLGFDSATWSVALGTPGAGRERRARSRRDGRRRRRHRRGDHRQELVAGRSANPGRMPRPRETTRAGGKFPDSHHAGIRQASTPRGAATVVARDTGHAQSASPSAAISGRGPSGWPSPCRHAIPV